MHIRLTEDFNLSPDVSVWLNGACVLWDRPEEMTGVPFSEVTEIKQWYNKKQHQHR